MNSKPGRNDPCHCGSGKKYKHCHLRSDEREHLAALQSVPTVPKNEPEGVAGDLPALDPGFRLPLRPPAKIGDIFSHLQRFGMATRDPELLKLLGDNRMLIEFYSKQPEIEAALEKLKPSEEEFHRLLADEEAVLARSTGLFGEPAFARMNFTASEVEQACEGLEDILENPASNEARRALTKAILSLATKERRNQLSMQLLMLLPKYVEEGRFIDAQLIGSVAQLTAEAEDTSNPFLAAMFLQGYKAWRAAQYQEREEILRELGLPPTDKLGPDDIEAWLARQAADPAKAARLEKLLASHPRLQKHVDTSPADLSRQAVSLLQRDDSACLYLQPEELEPWLPGFYAKFRAAAEKFGPLEQASELSEAQKKEAFDEFYLPAIREVVKGMFTPGRIKELAADLRAYRNRLFDAGEKKAAYQATCALNYIETEDEPPLNAFLVNLCFRSVQGLVGEGPE